MGWLFGNSTSDKEQKTEIVRLDQVRKGDYVRKIEPGYQNKKFSKVTIIQEIGTGHTNISYVGGGGCFFNDEKFERLT